MIILGNGNVGIGTTVPSGALHVNAASNAYIYSSTTTNSINGFSGCFSTTGFDLGTSSNHPVTFYQNNLIRARIDTSGRFLVGTSSGNELFNGGAQNPRFQIEGTTGDTSLASLTANRNDAAGPTFYLAHSRGTTVGGTTVLQSGDQLGLIAFAGTDGTNYKTGATITALVDAAPGTNDMPGRLVFSTTADGAASPTERMRIDNAGRVGIGTTTPSSSLHVRGGDLRVQRGPSTLDVSEITFANAFRTGRILSSYTNPASITETYIAFHTNRTGQSNDTVGEVMRIAGGNVGIGTTAPSVRLHVVGGSSSGAVDTAAIFAGGTNSTTGSGARIYLTGTPILPTGRAAYIEAVTGSTNNDHSLVFATNAALSDPQERARIDSSGRLLVGTSSATNNIRLDQKLGIISTSVNAGGLRLTQYATANTTAPLLDFRRSKGTTDGSTTLVSDGDTLGYITWGGADGTDLESIAAVISAQVDGTPGANDMPGRLVFSTTADGAVASTERMRITNDGLIGINQTSPSSDAQVSIGNLGTDTTLYRIRTNHASTAERIHIGFVNPNGLVGSIRTTNSATSYLTSSDYRLKENVVPLTGAIDRVNQLQVKRFNFIADPDTAIDGFLAHEAQEVVPECASGTKDEVDEEGNPIYQGIDQSKLVPLLTAALQEAIAEIASLKDRVAALEAS
jgi:hypothetical protein